MQQPLSTNYTTPYQQIIFKQLLKFIIKFNRNHCKFIIILIKFNKKKKPLQIYYAFHFLPDLV